MSERREVFDGERSLVMSSLYENDLEAWESKTVCI